MGGHQHPQTIHPLTRSSWPVCDPLLPFTCIPRDTNRSGLQVPWSKERVKVMLQHSSASCHSFYSHSRLLTIYPDDSYYGLCISVLQFSRFPRGRLASHRKDYFTMDHFIFLPRRSVINNIIILIICRSIRSPVPLYHSFLKTYHIPHQKYHTNYMIFLL